MSGYELLGATQNPRPRLYLVGANVYDPKTETNRLDAAIKKGLSAGQALVLIDGARKALIEAEKAEGFVLPWQVSRKEQRKRTSRGLDSHSQIASALAPTAAYPDPNGLKKWVLDAFFEGNVSESGRIRTEMIWSALWADMGNKALELAGRAGEIAAIPFTFAESTAKATGNVATSIVKKGEQLLTTPLWVWLLVAGGLAGVALWLAPNIVKSYLPGGR